MVHVCLLKSDTASIDDYGAIRSILGTDGFAVKGVPLGDEMVGGEPARALIDASSVIVAMTDEPTKLLLLALGYAIGRAKQVVLAGRSAELPDFLMKTPRVDLNDANWQNVLSTQLGVMSARETIPEDAQVDDAAFTRWLRDDPSRIGRLTGHEFERLVALLLTTWGVKAQAKRSRGSWNA